MSYPATPDTFPTFADYEDSETTALTLAVNASAFIVTVAHDILSTVTFDAVYGTEVSGTPASGQFRPIYGTNQIELGPLAAPASVNATYKCAGDIIYGSDINDIQTAVVAIETTLGVNPQGAYTDVADRLNALDTSAALIPDNKDFTGLCDGITTTFALDFAPKYPEAVWVYVNGLRARPSTHYTIVGLNVVMATAPLATDELYIDYFR